MATADTSQGQTISPRRAGSLRRPWPWQQFVGLLIVALAVAVRCTTLSFQSLWLDEVHTVIEANRPWSDLLKALLDPQQGYPLYTLGMRIWTALGTSEVALRLPSALAGVAAVPLLYLLGRHLFGQVTGWLAAALLALSPLAVWYSQEARSYAFLLLLTIAAWLFLWEATEKSSPGAWWALGGATVLALSIHRLAVLSAIGQLAYALYIARQGRFTQRYRWLLVGVLLAVLLLTVAGLWLVLGQEGAGRQFGAERDWSALTRTFTQFSLRIPPTPPEPGQGPDRRPYLIAFAAAALAGLAALLQDIRARGRKRRRAVFLLSFFAVPLAVFALLYLIRPFYYERYLLGVLPAYLLLLAVGTAALWRWAERLGRSGKHLLSLGLGTAALGTILLPLATSWEQVQYWTLSRLPSKEQFREATLYLQEHLHPGDLVIVHPDYIRPAVEFYQVRFPRVPLEVHVLPDLAAADYGLREFYADMENLSRGRRRAWLLIAPYHAPTKDPRNWVYEWFVLNPFLHCEPLDEQGTPPRFNGIGLHCVSFNEARRTGVLSPTISLNAPFGEKMLLWGADLEPFQQPLQPGDILPLTLYEQGLRRGLPRLEGVVRLVGEGGTVWAEEAREPLGGNLPTPRWIPGDQFMDYHELPLPEGLPAGRYTVQAGFRPLADPAAYLPLPDGTFWVPLGTVEVVPKGGSP